MSLKSQIKSDQTGALKEKQTDKLSTLRMLWAEIKNLEIKKQKELTDENVLEIISRQVKQLKDAIKEFEAGGRNDLVEKNQAEIAILSAYLPEQMLDGELESIVKEVITQTGAESKKDFGKVMGAVMEQVKGQTDGGRVKEMVGKMLGN